MRPVTRGAKEGICNICGKYTSLTEDHIPPKGVGRPTQVELMGISALLAVDKPKKSSRFSQNGVKYRSLCGDCNSGRLGHRYDPSLIALTNAIGDSLKSRLHLPSEMAFKTKPNRLMRSLVGHLLAFGVNQHRTGSYVNELTDYLLDEEAQFPTNLSPYYWVYPYNDQVLVKTASMLLRFGTSPAVFALLKFFPIAFLIIVDQPDTWTINLSRLDVHLTQNIDDETELPFRFVRLPPQRWPEAPGDNGVILYADKVGAAAAIPRPVS